MSFNPTRRQFVAALAGLLAVVSGTIHGRAADGAAEPAAARIQAFYDVLLETMKQAAQLGIEGRYDKLTSAIQETFDLPTMTRIAIGPSWTSIALDQQAALIKAFERMTTATYASRFDGYAGERFVVNPMTEARNSGRIVRTKLIPSTGEPVTLDYLMRGAGNVWKVVDVYLNGTISELAVRRSEFASILKSDGPQALIARLQERSDSMLNG